MRILKTLKWNNGKNEVRADIVLLKDIALEHGKSYDPKLICDELSWGVFARENLPKKVQYWEEDLDEMKYDNGSYVIPRINDGTCDNK